MEEERRLVEEPLGRAHVLEDHALGERPELCLLLGTELLAGEDDDRRVAQHRVFLHLLEQLEAGHVRQPQIDDAAFDRPLVHRAKHLECLGAGRDGRHFDVIVHEEVDDAGPLDIVVLDDEQPFLVRSDIRGDAVERVLEVLGRARLHEVGERAVGEAMLALFLNREDLHGNVSRGGVELQAVQHRPAEHVGQEHVQRNRRRQVLPRQRQRGRAASARQCP